MKWMITEDKLGADQIEVIDEIGKITNQPIWIKGHAGSGKSVLLLHSLADYIIRNPHANVCVVVFTNALVDLLETGLKQIPKLANKTIPVFTIYRLKNRIGNGKNRYDAIFCDEVQDLPLSFIRLMKSATNHLIIAGDAEQSIYNTVPTFNDRPATSDELHTDIEPIEKSLNVIYRLTESVIKVLKKVFPALLTDKPNFAKEDTEISLYEFDSVENEISFCWGEINQTNNMRTSEVVAILINSHDSIIDFINRVLLIEGCEEWERINGNDGKPDYGILNQYLNSNSVPLMYVGNNFGSLKEADDKNKIIIMTYHSSKGLDFDYVYLPMVNNNMYIHEPINSLLLVALSRSKSGLFISYTGSLYSRLYNFLRDIEIKVVQENDDNNEIGLPF
ncbi:MAG: 3'-5' exonuclease [bacterium]